MLSALVVATIAAAPAAIAPALVPPSSVTLNLRTQGRGVQIYVCEAKPDKPGTYGWSFKAPRATLYSFDGRIVGHHYAGPSWEGVDGGKVVGDLLAKAPSPEPSAIDWLLLSAKSANRVGVLGKTAYVQRIRTVGGRAPDQGCSAANAGAEAQTPYSAEYDFYSVPTD
ncbi:MAG TPA: DUF3455 domain-containing protein [Caulobacteraceae bacterium]|jgi:hypothetical protein